jgi:hypothetical protein
MASLARFAIWRGHGSLKDGDALVFDGTATTKAALFVALSEVLRKSSLFEQSSKQKKILKAVTLALERGCCLWGIQHRQELLS